MEQILVVDDTHENIDLMKEILSPHYRVQIAVNGKLALKIAQSSTQPDLILLDVMMPDMDGFEVCQKLKSNPVTESIPVIFVTAKSDVESEIKGFDLGAVDYIYKPVSPPIVLKRVQTHLSLIRSKELEDSQKAAIFMLGEAGHYNDTDTGVHIWRMAAYSRVIAEAVGWSKHMAERLELAAPMHDTGKIGIPDSILKAPRKLTQDEWKHMQKHCEIGSGILSKDTTPIFKMAAEVANCHHEKWDGSGYPSGLSGTAIPESARIVAIADVFDALTMKRPYKEAWSVEDAVAEIHKISGSHFDPHLVNLFEQLLPNIIKLKDEWYEK